MAGSWESHLHNLGVNLWELVGGLLAGLSLRKPRRAIRGSRQGLALVARGQAVLLQPWSYARSHFLVRMSPPLPPRVSED